MDKLMDKTTTTIVEQVATSVCRALLPVQLCLQDLLPRMGNGVQDASTPRNDGVQFRVGCVLDQLHQAQTDLQLFAQFQIALCRNPCSMVVVEATNEFLGALEALEINGIGLGREASDHYA
ncbi:expressed unknown protein [Seminavis robusta]|uniref:Uncharacterized protein n=1 Tax=Seminavis robusta TaxID=568900 RepID=A0A9N8DBW3_9STRA|nr:expressed unknown protein [Seminavis robusta]|eukprot:Sro77_g041990.1 n/a (121) ;mRNA; r:49289-49651